MQKKIIILGGGISGLATAWFIRKKFGAQAKITIVEKSDHVGGWLKTLREKEFLFDQGPKSCRTYGGLETLKLIQDLHLQDQVITGSQNAQSRYLYMNQKMCSLPKSFFSLFFSSIFWKNFPALIREISVPLSKSEDESIYEFFSRRFNSQIAEVFVDSITSGIFAGDIQELSLKSCFPRIYDWEQNYGSVLRGLFSRKRKLQNEKQSDWIEQVQKSSLFTFREGMQSLVDTLHMKIEASILVGDEVKKLQFDPNRVRIETKNHYLESDFLISTIPAYALGDLLEPHHLPISQLLKEIPYTSIASVHLGYHQTLLKQFGFGYLIPIKEQEKILGAVWDSSAFPQQNHLSQETRITVMMGGRHCKDFELYKESDYIEIAKKAMVKHLSISTTPDFIRCTISRNAIPQYLVGHEKKIRNLQSYLHALYPRLKVTANYLNGVSVNECIANARILAGSVDS